MNTSKLYRWEKDGALKVRLEALGTPCLQQLVRQFEAERDVYEGVIKNYPPHRRKECSVPYLKHMDALRDAVVVELERRGK